MFAPIGAPQLGPCHYVSIYIFVFLLAYFPSLEQEVLGRTNGLLPYDTTRIP
jgi:hypothetical protein